MVFTNSEVDISSLPAAEHAELKPVNRKYLTLLRIEWLLTSVVLLGIAITVISLITPLRNSYWWLLIAAGVLFLLALYFFVQEKSFPFIAYSVRDHDVIFRRGWLVRTIKVCPYNRIQNCSLHTGPLERRFGLASLTLFTAGSDGADLKIPGLTLDEAESLRQFILTKINGQPAKQD
jgi:membrane protein YdbS with pleckstrin-like domain